MKTAFSLVLLGLILQISFVAAEKNYDNQLTSFFRSFPRFNFKGQEAPSSFDPSNTEYLEGVALTGTPFVAIAALSIIFGLLFVCCSFCCFLCSSNKQKRYSNCEIFVPKVFLATFILFLIGAVAVGIGGNVNFHDSLSGVLDDIQTQQLRVTKDMNNVEENLDKINATIQIQEVKTIVDDANRLWKESKEERKVIDHIENIRGYTFFAIFSLVGLICLLSFCGICFQSKFFGVIIGFLGIFILPVLWISASVSIPVGVVVSDSCPNNLQDWLMNQTHSTSDSNWIGYYMNCIGESPFGNTTEYAQNEYAIIQAEIDAAIKNNVSEAIIDALKQIEKTLGELLNDLDDLSSCADTQAAWEHIKGDICETMIQGIGMVFIGSVIGGLFVIPVMICGCLVKNRNRTTRTSGEYIRLDESNDSRRASEQNPFLD